MIDGLTHVQDLLPALASLAGIRERPAKLDGIDLAQVLRGELAVPKDRMLVINYSRMPNRNRRGIDLTQPRKEAAGILWEPWRLLLRAASLASRIWTSTW